MARMNNWKSYTTVIGAFLATISLIAVTWTYNPVALAQGVEKNAQAIEDVKKENSEVKALILLSDVKADIRAIERTPKDERSDFENSELEELKAKKESLTREITK